MGLLARFGRCLKLPQFDLMPCDYGLSICGVNNDEIWLPFWYVSNFEQCSNRFQPEIIAVINLLQFHFWSTCMWIGVNNDRYDFINAMQVILINARTRFNVQQYSIQLQLYLHLGNMFYMNCNIHNPFSLRDCIRGTCICDISFYVWLYSIQPGVLCHPTLVFDMLHLVHWYTRILRDNFETPDWIGECTINHWYECQNTHVNAII